MPLNPVANNDPESHPSRQRQGLRWLRFVDAGVEHAFVQHHFAHARQRVQVHLWLSIIMVVIVAGMDEYVLNRPDTGVLLVLRISALTLLLTCVVLTARRSWYDRYYSRAIQVLLPLFGICVVLNELLAPINGALFFTPVVLTVFGMYLLVGLLFFSALGIGLFTLAIYLVGAVLTDTPLQRWIFNGTLLLFTNVLAASAAYHLERLLRSSFMEAQLLSDMANRDGLTGIYNRRAFDEHMLRIWQQAVRERRHLALLLVDIDHFKAYNDYYGHQAGDHCLQQVARVLSNACRRPLDFTARFGGEEFAVVLYDVQYEYVAEVTAHIQTELRQLSINHHATPARQLTVSMGVASILPDPQRSVFGCIQLADEALYVAKEAGRDRIVIKDTEYADLNTGAFRQSGNVRHAL